MKITYLVYVYYRNLAVKRNPELNLKLTGDVNHNMKHSEVDVDIRYGPDFKDDEKQIALAASMDRNLKSLTYASASLNGQFLMGKVIVVLSLFQMHNSLFLNDNGYTFKERNAVIFFCNPSQGGQ